jgi:protoheme IX farnesyltransferase
MEASTDNAKAEPTPSASTVRGDLMALTKFRLSLLVITTTVAGYLAGCNVHPDWGILLHTVIGTAFSAFGASVFNQLMEIEPDAVMRRTMDRPLPARRMPPGLAFGIGAVISAFGMLHLARMVRPEDPQPAYLAALTLLLYVLIYTPMKRRSSLNTIVGAVAGALPPVIGWTAAGRPYDTGAAVLFGILFFWQLPHFIAINWMYREEYEKAGFVMWSNNDESGRVSAWLCVVFSVALLAVCVWPSAAGLAGWGHGLASAAMGGFLVFLSVKFLVAPERQAARKVFFFTLLFLPVVLVSLLVFWRG